MAARSTVIGVALSLALSGCASQQPAPPVPPDLPPEFETDRGPHAGQLPSKEWYRDFGSDELNSFVDLAASHNWDEILCNKVCHQ